MITLSTEKGLVSIGSWDEVTGRPGFVVDIDPKTVGLKTILGSYVFKVEIRCGLSTCHQPHGKGYLVQLIDGRETNIGNGCGKTHFSVDFEEMRVRFDKDVREQGQRERLTTTLNQLPSINARVSALIDESKGVQKRLQALTNFNKGVPKSIVDRMNQMVRARDGNLTQSRIATANERDLMKATGQPLPKDGPAYVVESIGNIEGLAALYPENDLRKLLIENLRTPLDEFTTVDVDVLNARELGQWAKWAESIELATQSADVALGLGKRLLIPENLQQLLQTVTDRAQIREMKSFIANG